jgi:hypothetical protein
MSSANEQILQLFMKNLQADISSLRHELENKEEVYNYFGQLMGFQDTEKSSSSSERPKAQSAAVQELNFTTLKFEVQQSEKMGEYEIAHKNSNITDKWQSANNILRSSNATIKTRYHGEDYQYSYWLYGEDKIYRQKLKPKV